VTATAPPKPDTTFVVMLGASRYPRDEKLSNEQFLRSAKAVRQYFESRDTFSLPSDNLLWLFDSSEAPSHLDGRIRDFLRVASHRDESRRPRDVIVYYIGHGFFDEQKSYFLALQSLRPDAPDSNYRFQALQRAIKSEARHARKYLILDACYSGAASREWMSLNADAQLVLNEVAAEATDDLPHNGTALLCATNRNDPARAPAKAEYTMFSGALLDVLQTETAPAGGYRLSLRQLRDLAYDVIRHRYPNDAVRPEVHSPDQKDGDIAGISLFPTRPAAAAVLEASAPIERAHDALSSDTFTNDAAIQCVVVNPEGELGEEDVPLVQHVRRAWEHAGARISAEVNRYRAARGLPLVPAADSVEPPFVLAELQVQRAFESQASVTAAIDALCKAELAVFDLTGFQPGVLLLLGIRAVARRGVTLSSIGGTYIVGGQLAIPFNLQLLNLAAHSRDQEDEGKGLRPWELLAEKIKNGYRELADLPHYLDLPAYESVRQLGVESSAYRPIQYDEKVLVLCPFSPEYTRRNWKRFLEAELPGKLMQRLRRAGKVVDDPPRLERLLDLKTPRLVAQTLFESIRLVDMCIIDWTELRPNVMFEAGVRLATNALAAVHIVEQTEPGVSGPRSTLAHVAALWKLFAPIAYRCKVGDTAPYEEMITCFEASLAASNGGHPGFVYTAVGTALDRRSHPAALPLVVELMRAANILASDDEESTGISPILFHEVNKQLVAEAYEAAADRRLAAWLFLTRRYSPEEIAGDTHRLQQFELLSVQARRWARKQGRQDIIDEVAKQQRAVKLMTQRTDQ
jgi:hypothetical protein